MHPTEDWGPTHKNITAKLDVIPEVPHNGNNRDNSFDNPSFNVTYTFETAI